MTEEQFATACAQVKAAFGDISTAVGASGERYIRAAAALLPKGCSPARTAVLLVLNGARPQVYVKPGVKLPNGRDPRSTSQVNVNGEAWLQYSYSFPYDPNVHTLTQFVGAALARFKLAE